MVFPNGHVTIKYMIGRQNSESYKNLLQNFAIPIILENFEENYLFQQDNCSIHVSKCMKKFFQEIDFKLLSWPSRSPDLNIMENVWKIISDIVYEGSQPENVSNLKDKITEAVSTINKSKKETIVGLYNSFRHRLTDLLKNNGKLITNL